MGCGGSTSRVVSPEWKQPKERAPNDTNAHTTTSVQPVRKDSYLTLKEYIEENRTPEEVQYSSTVVLEDNVTLNKNTNNNTVPPTAEEDRETKAATVIQSHYRGYIVRRRKSNDSVFLSEERPSRVVDETAEVVKSDSQLEMTVPIVDGNENGTSEIAETDSKLETVTSAQDDDDDLPRVPAEEKVEIDQLDNQVEAGVPYQDVPSMKEIEMSELAAPVVNKTFVHQPSIREEDEEETRGEAMEGKETGGEVNQDSHAEQSESQTETQANESQQIESTSAVDVEDEVLWTAKQFEAAQSTSNVAEPTEIEDTEQTGTSQTKDEGSLTETTIHQDEGSDDKEKTKEVLDAGLSTGEDQQVDTQSELAGLSTSEDEDQQVDTQSELDPKQGEDEQTQIGEKQQVEESSTTEKTEGDCEDKQTVEVSIQMAEKEDGVDNPTPLSGDSEEGSGELKVYTV